MDEQRGQPLSAADGAWWRMERPTNPMTITAVFTFAEPLAYDALSALLTAQLLPHPRFRQRVVDGGAGHAYWQDAPDFSLADHVVRAALPASAGREELEALVSRLMSEPLARDRPHWRFDLVERYRGGSALVVRVHHCIGDGISLVQLLLTMAEPVDGAPAGAVGATAERHVERRRVPRRARASAHYEPEVPAARAARDDAQSLVSRTGLRAAIRLGGGIAGVLARLLDLRADPRTVLQGRLGRVKRAAWSEPIPLERVRAAGRATGGTINDVLLSAVAGALGRYLAERGDRVAGESLRAVVPVNLRRPDELHALGNKFGLVFLSLPVGEPDPVARLRATKASMDRIKQSPEALVVFGLLRAFGKTTAGTLVAAVKLLARRASAVMTNVPGPRAPLRFAGATIDGVMFWVPQSGRLGLGVSVLSYAGTVRVGVAADERLVPDPSAVVAHFHDALHELVAAALPQPAPPPDVRPQPAPAPALHLR